jgi:hypothetical protein
MIKCALRQNITFSGVFAHGPKRRSEPLFKKLPSASEMPFHAGLRLTPAHTPDLKKMKAKIEIVADFEDLKEIAEILKQMKK